MSQANKILSRVAGNSGQHVQAIVIQMDKLMCQQQQQQIWFGGRSNAVSLRVKDLIHSCILNSSLCFLMQSDCRRNV